MSQRTDPETLERYSFLWSEARLVVAALALLIGGIPPVIAYNPIPGLNGVVRLLLIAAWILSGIAAAYLLYRWNAGHRVIFGAKRNLDTIAFFVMIVSGLNLGFAGLLGKNIGMSIVSGRGVFALLALIYLASAGYLFRRWKEHGKKIF